MSEYQYYEFVAVDTPLTPKQQTALRALSTRATITATSFTNEYHWSDLKGDPLDWVRRYFDAHIYSASWGSCRLLLRLPCTTLDKATLAEFTRHPKTSARSRSSGAFEIKVTTEHWILDWSFSDDSGESERFADETDGPGWMSRLLPLRDELLRGDTRPLYLGWLARVCEGELADEDIEPPMPAGLQTLTSAQIALAEFLLIDPDWLVAAAQTSAALASQARDPAIDTWLAGQTPEAMRSFLRLLIDGRSHEAERGLRQRFITWQHTQLPDVSAGPVRRTVALIEVRRGAAETLRLQHERKAGDAMQAKRHAERAKHLAVLAKRADHEWESIDKTLQRGTGVAYDQALHTVKELAEALSQNGHEANFHLGLARLMDSNGKRVAWVSRLTKAGFTWKEK